MKGRQRAVAVVRMQGRGQLTLPAAFRKAVGVRPGDVLLLEERGPGHFEVRVLSRRSLLEFPQVQVDDFDMQSAREEMEQELAGEAVDKGHQEPVDGSLEVAAARDA
ncbi:MAG: AbrB family transcriptional regulator [Bacillota bacterium]|nr:MAG: AbrB family transcriptional regulator [Bacillota bacterium]